MQAPILYFIDKDSFLTSSRFAQKHPTTKEYIIDVLGAIINKLPTTELPKYHKWRFVNNNWIAVLDCRGMDGFLQDGTPFRITEFGDTPNGWSKEKVVIPETLVETKTKALAIVRELRKEKEYSGCTSQGILWDTDEKSERRLNSAVTIMKDNPNILAIPNFKPSDKVSIVLTLPMAIKAGEDIMLYFGECFAWEDNIAEQINKCTTVEQVKDIVNSL